MALAAVLAAALLPGCASHHHRPTAATTAPTAPGPQRGGVLRMGVTRPASLDPAEARTLDELLIAGQLYRSLTAYDPKTLDAVPSLASSWTSSADQRHWDFTLAPGLQFSDGSPITSADVKASLARVMGRGSGSPGAPLLTDVSAVTVPSTTVVHIDLSRPLSVLPSVLASPNLGIVPQASGVPVSGEVPVSSGPFRVTSQTADKILLERAPGAAALPGGVPGGAPLLDGVEFDLFDDEAAAYQAFVDGRVDWSRVPASKVTEAKARYGDGAFAPYVAELFYGFNLKSKVMADARFREAIIEAVDRDGIINTVYHGAVQPLDGIVVNGIPGYAGTSCGDRCTYDPARSRQLLAQLFPPGGPARPTVEIDFDQDATQGAVASLIQSDLGSVNLAAVLHPRPLADYQKAAAAGHVELFHLGWVGGYPSPQAFLDPLFSSGSAANLTRFADARVDAALTAARGETDPAQRLQDYATAEQLALSDLPVLPIAQYQTTAVETGRVRGLQSLLTGEIDLTKVWLAV